MESFLSRYKNVLVLIVVLLVQVVGLAVQVRRAASDAPEGRQVRLIRYWVVSLVTPPEKLVHSIGRGFRGMWSNYAYLRGVRRENRDLKAEVERLRIEQAGLMEDARQGQRLQKLLSFKEHYIYKTQPAQVVGTSGSDLSHVLIIDKGSRDGIRPDMPVITPDGVVGKIKEVFPRESHLLLISDQTSGAGVLLESLRLRGVLRGNSLGQPQIVNMTTDERIKPGERVLTSGGDQVYPRGLPVGVVDHTIPDPEHDGYVAIVVRTAANLSRLEEVLVVTDVSERMTAAEQQDIQQSEAEADTQKRAADILSERLPGLKDPNAPASAATDAPAQEPGGDPGRPPKPGVALRPDRFSPNETPPANSLTPGQSLPRTTTGAATTQPSDGTNPAAPASTPRPRLGTGAAGQAPATTTGIGSTSGSGSTTDTRPATGDGSAAGTRSTAGTAAAPVRKPRVVAPDGSTVTAPKPMQPATATPKPTQPATTPKPASPQPQPDAATPDAKPPGGRL
jgi:rod shape-determining protein MreC